MFLGIYKNSNYDYYNIYLAIVTFCYLQAKINASITKYLGLLVHSTKYYKTR